MTLFFRDLLGLAAVGDTVSFQRLPTYHRDLLEVYAQEHHDNRLKHAPAKAGVGKAPKPGFSTTLSMHAHAQERAACSERKSPACGALQTL